MKLCWVVLCCTGVIGFGAGSLRAQDNRLLTLHQAQEIALKNHPQISVADLLALAAQQQTIEARAGYLPNLSANMVSVGTVNNNTRLAAIGALNNPAIFDRNAEGAVLTQLITDFGRTLNLTRAARFHAQAQQNNAQATREQIVLAVDEAYFAALQAQAVSQVATQTVAARQTFLEQVQTLATNKLRSELDVSFARVDLEQGRLLMSKALNDVQAAFAQLANVLALPQPTNFVLAEESMPLILSSNVSDFVQLGLRDRPDLLRLRNEEQSALKFARAERALLYPNLSAVGSAGVTPVHDPALGDNFAAAGIVLNVPIFTGGLYTGRKREAVLRAKAAAEAVRDGEDNVIRDVRVAWLNAQNAYERLQITEDLAKNAEQAFELSDARFKAGLSSIVEFDQALLNKVSADITYANTKYEYLIMRAALNFQIGARP